VLLLVAVAVVAVVVVVAVVSVALFSCWLLVVVLWLWSVVVSWLWGVVVLWLPVGVAVVVHATGWNVVPVIVRAHSAWWGVWELVVWLIYWWVVGVVWVVGLVVGKLWHPQVLHVLDWSWVVSLVEDHISWVWLVDWDIVPLWLVLRVAVVVSLVVAIVAVVVMVAVMAVFLLGAVVALTLVVAVVALLLGLLNNLNWSSSLWSGVLSWLVLWKGLVEVVSSLSVLVLSLPGWWGLRLSSPVPSSWVGLLLGVVSEVLTTLVGIVAIVTVVTIVAIVTIVTVVTIITIVTIVTIVTVVSVLIIVTVVAVVTLIIAIVVVISTGSVLVHSLPWLLCLHMVAIIFGLNLSDLLVAVVTVVSVIAIVAIVTVVTIVTIVTVVTIITIVTIVTIVSVISVAVVIVGNVITIVIMVVVGSSSVLVSALPWLHGGGSGRGHSESSDKSLHS